MITLDSVNVFPITGGALGGSLLSMSGPCFDKFSSLVCDFGDGQTSSAVFANSLRAYCPIPMLNRFGRLQLAISGRTESGDNVSFPFHSYTASKFWNATASLKSIPWSLSGLKISVRRLTLPIKTSKCQTIFPVERTKCQVGKLYVERYKVLLVCRSDIWRD